MFLRCQALGRDYWNLERKRIYRRWRNPNIRYDINKQGKNLVTRWSCSAFKAQFEKDARIIPHP